MLAERLAHPLLDPPPAFVAGNGREPGGRVPGLGSVQQAPVGGEESLLDGVLSLLPVAHQDATEPEHGRAVPREQRGQTRTGRPMVGAAGYA